MTPVPLRARLAGALAVLLLGFSFAYAIWLIVDEPEPCLVGVVTETGEQDSDDLRVVEAIARAECPSYEWRSYLLWTTTIGGQVAGVAYFWLRSRQDS